MGPETAKADLFDEGIANVIHGFQLDLLTQQSASVSDNACRGAVAFLNILQLTRAEILEEGYDVSDILFYDIYHCYTNIANAAS